MQYPVSFPVRALRVSGGQLVVLTVAAAVSLVLHRTGLEPSYDLIRLFSATPHGRYAAELRLEGLDETVEGRQWLDAASAAIQDPARITLPRSQVVTFEAQRPAAAAFAAKLRRGQRYVAEAQVTGADPTSVFVDLFERDGEDLRHLASAAPDEPALILEMRSDADLIVRVQPELQRDVRVTLKLRAEPTLRLPVAQATHSRIQSFFGDSRDNGSRRHHGVDIFAARGTPVVAAADGVVSSVRTNGLGGTWSGLHGRHAASFITTRTSIASS